MGKQVSYKKTSKTK